MKNKNIGLVYASRFISSIGDQFYTLALSTTLYTLTGSALASTGYLAIKGLVYILGLFIYRSPKPDKVKQIVIFGDYARGLLTLLLLFLMKEYFYGIYFVVFFMELIQLYYSPARVLLVHNLSNTKQLSHKLDQIITTLSLTLGLSAGGFVTFYFGGYNAILINGITFFICGTLSCFIKYRNSEIKDKNNTYPIKWLFRKSIFQRNYVTLFSLFSLPAFAFNSLIVVYIFQILQGDSRLYGIVESVMAIGLFVGSVVSLKKGKDLVTRIKMNSLYLVLMGCLYTLSLVYTNFLWFSTILFLSAVINMLYSSYYRAAMSEIFNDSNDLANAWTINRSIINLCGSLGIFAFSMLSDMTNIVFAMTSSGMLLTIIGVFVSIKFSGTSTILKKEIET
ncbi:hypothetical protein [Bacillus infantis]|uniref:hypothetical protein n=1 Tax=Bacillus infantis TaxID=324767 RepID=UPI00209F2DEA|nr:hypothetical protein [Bacillus infantis]MCP1161333.1 hypothetical protein [Bacillus infantis]